MAADDTIPDALWQPVAREEADSVVEKKLPTDAARTAMLDAACSILARGAPPSEPTSQQTGLVVGYVQSGKTLSFTTVMALARDNDYRVVIVVTGISKPLLGQSIKRLKKDLSIDEDEGLPQWRHFENPTAKNHSAIERVLKDWEDYKDTGDVPKIECPTILITVMKNHSHLKNLVGLITQLNMQGVPTLIVDDEADQASLNTQVKKKGRESPTYRRLLGLRAAIPCHTFLQYTATPQAPLLINIIDMLSPKFVEVLEPGEGYVGGKVFFQERPELIRDIPSNEVPTADNPIDAPPSSLMQALRVFLVGVAVGLVQVRAHGKNRSMLVHPSRTTPEHQEYSEWINLILGDWKNLVSQTATDPDRISFIEDLRVAYADLMQTTADLPSFDEIIGKLGRALRQINVEVMNAAETPTPEINWSESYGWILVGGQAMDRGFTVEGLTVTYMPRGTGIGNADTIQQRARFFGYKAPYLGYCRVYLEQDVVTAFQDYVAHEEDIRRQLQDIRNQGLPLSEWKRAFVLARNLRPCRDNVIEHQYARGAYADDWIIQQFVKDSENVINTNRGAVQNLLDSLTFVENEGHPDRQPVQLHDVCSNARLDDVIAKFLMPYQFTSGLDFERRNILLLQFSHALDQNPDEQCTIYRMSRQFKRERSIYNNGKIRNLFQGEYPVNPKEQRGSIYPGDRGIVDQGNVTIQVHLIDIKESDQIIAENVPVIAVWIPGRMGLPLLIQDQP